MPRKIEIGDLPYPAREVLENLALKISMARKARKWSRGDLAAKAEIGLSTMNDIENAIPTVQFAHYLSVLWALDLLDVLRIAAEPRDDSVAIALMQSRLPDRVRAEME